MKKYFYFVKNIVPYELEENLENMARQGFLLKYIGQTGLLYFEFKEDEPGNYKYVVDYSKLPKAMYVGALIDKGWDYLGQVGDNYIWRIKIEEGAPERFSDRRCMRDHCYKMAMILGIIAVLCAVAAIGLICGVFYEKSMGSPEHTLAYIIEAILQLPFVGLFGYLSYKLFGARRFYDY